MPRKTDFQLGLETILNNPNTSFLRKPEVFREIHTQSAMPLSSMIRQVGKGSRQQKKKTEPSDDERSKARLQAMENKSEK
jgi:hypothetical protein